MGEAVKRTGWPEGNTVVIRQEEAKDEGARALLRARRMPMATSRIWLARSGKATLFYRKCPWSRRLTVKS